MSRSLCTNRARATFFLPDARVIGEVLREKLEQHAEVVPPKILFEKPAADGTYKWLLGMDGGNDDPSSLGKRRTLRNAHDHRPAEDVGERFAG